MKQVSLNAVDGTIAKLLTDNMDKLYLCGNNVNLMKSTVIKLISEGDVKSASAKETAIRIFEKAPNVSSFLSTLTTYITGLKV